MNRKDLQTRFNIIGNNDDIMLYCKRGEEHYGIGYRGNISLKSGKAIFNGKSYSDLDSLDTALTEWEKTLPYPVDTYCPMTREISRAEERIIWYLTEKLGFKLNRDIWSQPHTYIKKIGPVNDIKFSIKLTGDLERIEIESPFGAAIFMQEVSDAETGIEVISSIVNSQVLLMAKDMVDIISVCDEKVTADIDAIVQDNRSLLGYAKSSFKDMMVERLETVLKQLKDEK